MSNENVKDLIQHYRLHYYEVADSIGISPGYLSTLLRKPLSAEMEKKTLDAINRIIHKEKELCPRVH